MVTELMEVQTETSRICSEHTFTTSDGVELFYRAWAPHGASEQAVILFHRGHEHSGRWQDFVDRIDMQDVWFFAYDARGHGRSPGERGAAESFATLVRDADEFAKHIAHKHGVFIDQTAVVGQSVGAVVAATWIHDYAPPVKAMALATPALRIKLYVPGAIPGLRLLNKVKPNSFIKSYVKPRMLTHDKAEAKAYAEDPLISPQIATNVLLDLHDTATRLIEDAGAIHTPTLMLVSGADHVVGQKPQLEFFNRLSSTVKEKKIYPNFYHSTYWEKNRDEPIALTRQFLIERLAEPAQTPSLLDAHERGYSKSICEEYSTPLPLLSPKRWCYAAQRAGLNTAGRLSLGVRIGWRTGFDSGESLDHIYRNRAEGITPLGRLIDRFYLDTPGWRGIRQRKVHMSQLLDRAIQMTTERGEPVRLLDIAAGPGRYVLEAIERHPDVDFSAVLCDWDEGGLAWGRGLADAKGITSVDYRRSNAFDAKAVASHHPRPNIGVVSGLYELFPDNGLVLESLRGMANAIDEGGLLLYTNQPWHPQQEMIARVLPNRDGDPWVMRCRTQAEMDQLVATVGFEKLTTLIDADGIFTVSLAVKR